MQSDSSKSRGLSRRGFLASASAALAVTPSTVHAGNSHVALANFAAGRGGEVRVLMPAGSEANLAPVAEAFRRLSGVDVALVEGPLLDIGNRVIVAETLGDSAFDVALPATFEIPDLAAAGAILALDELPPGPPSEDEVAGEVYPEGDSFEGSLYGYQTDGDTYLAFYNRRMLEDPRMRGEYEEKFGEALELPNSWDKFDRLVRFFGDQEGYHGAALSHHAGYIESEFWVRLHASGIWPLSSSLEPQFVDDHGVAVIEDLIRVSEASLLPKDGETDLIATWKNFDTATAFASLGWGGSQKYFRRSGKGFVDDVLHAPLPGAPGVGTPKEMSYFNWGWSYVVPKSARDPELAHAFSRFAVTQEMSTEAVRQVGGFFDPFRTSHYEDAQIRDIYGEEFLKVHQVSLRHSMPDFYLANRSVYFSSLGMWLERAVQGRVTPQEAVKRIADDWMLTTITSGAERQQRRWSELRAKYPAELQGFLTDL